MVDVGVAENHGGQPVGGEGERLPVALVTLLAALDHPTIEQEVTPAAGDAMTRPRDLACCAVKGDSHELTRH